MRTAKTFQFISVSFIAAALLASCGGGSSSGDFKTDPTTGVQYRFITHDDKGATPPDNSFAHIVMLWTGKNAKGDADSVFLDTHKRVGDSTGAILIPLKKSFNGCLEQGIMMMAKGDSAIFHVNADSLFLKTFHTPAERLPAFVKSNPTFTFSIKLLGFQTQQEMMAERQADMQKRQQEALARKAQEPIDITAYLQKNNLSVKPDADSIFYLRILKKGTGQQVKEGDSVEINSTGMFLNGQVFDKSDKGPGSPTYKFLYTRKMTLIKGWISVLGKMRQGEEVEVLIPSAMAYGAQGNLGIMPFTPLIFDIDLVKVKSNK